MGAAIPGIYDLATTNLNFAEPETDDLVKRLWYERDNGIASIRQGVPSLAEYQQSLPLLRELTERVRQQPNEVTYQYVGTALQQAKRSDSLNACIGV